MEVEDDMAAASDEADAGCGRVVAILQKLRQKGVLDHNFECTQRDEDCDSVDEDITFDELVWEPQPEMVKAIERVAGAMLHDKREDCAIEELRWGLPPELSASNELELCLRWMDRSKDNVLLFRNGVIQLL